MMADALAPSSAPGLSTGELAAIMGIPRKVLTQVAHFYSASRRKLPAHPEDSIPTFFAAIELGRRTRFRIRFGLIGKAWAVATAEERQAFVAVLLEFAVIGREAPCATR